MEEHAAYTKTAAIAPPNTQTTLMTTSLLYPMAMHVALAALLYVLLTVARAPSVWGIGRKSDGASPWANVERRISANLSNQFEWPVFFYAGCLTAGAMGSVDSVFVALAWLFVAGRFLHSAVQVGTTDVRLRGIVFTINFLAVLAMWGWLLLIRS